MTNIERNLLADNTHGILDLHWQRLFVIGTALVQQNFIKWSPESCNNTKKYKTCPKTTHVIDMVRMPLIEVMEPFGTSVFNKAFVFFTQEKHVINRTRNVSKKTTIVSIELDKTIIHAKQWTVEKLWIACTKNAKLVKLKWRKTKLSIYIHESTTI